MSMVEAYDPCPSETQAKRDRTIARARPGQVPRPRRGLYERALPFWPNYRPLPQAPR